MVRETPACRDVGPLGGRADGNGLLDRDADHAAPFRPRAIVVANTLVAEELVQDEPAVGRALADPAIGDDVLVGGHALRRVEVAQLLGGLEPAVLANRLGPRDRGGPGDVTR